jgi:hypothetical protein
MMSFSDTLKDFMVISTLKIQSLSSALQSPSPKLVIVSAISRSWTGLGSILLACVSPFVLLDKVWLPFVEFAASRLDVVDQHVFGANRFDFCG